MCDIICSINKFYVMFQVMSGGHVVGWQNFPERGVVCLPSFFRPFLLPPLLSLFHLPPPLGRGGGGGGGGGFDCMILTE